MIPQYDQDGNELPPLPAGAIGRCRRCGRPIRSDAERRDPYCSMIPFRGSWGGFMHQFCPPSLRVIRTVGVAAGIRQ